MVRLTLTSLWAHKLRLALTGVAVVLGVAFMSGTMVLTDTVGRTFDSMFEAANDGVDVVVQQEAITGEHTVARDRVPEAVVERLGAVDGVDAAVGSVQGYAQIVDASGDARALEGIGETLGTNWIADEALNPFSIATGRPPAGPSEVVLDRATAVGQGWELGDPVTVIAKGAPTELTVVGTATFGSVDGLPGSSLVAVSDEAAEVLFAEPGAFDRVLVAGDGTVDSDELRDRVETALGAGRLEVLTGATDTAAKQAEFQEHVQFFNTFLLAFAFVALFVGTFIIYNTFSILVAQRTRDMAMLRAIGASRRQVLSSVLAESAAVGAVAGVVGLGLGVLVSFALKALFGAVGVDLPDEQPVVARSTVVIALVVGIAVTVLSAVGPALRAGRVRPIAALRDVAVDRSATSVARSIAGGTVTVAGIAAFAAGVVDGGSRAIGLLGLGATATVVGVFVLGPMIARPVVRVLGAPVARWSGTTGHLARENALRSPKRTAATAAALMVGVALVGFITILASSTKASVHDALDRSLVADYVVDSGAWGDGGFAPELAAELDRLPEVAAVSGHRSAPAEVDGTSTALDAVDATTIESVFDLDVVDGSLEAVASGSIAVQRDTAAARSLRVGDPVTVRFASGTTDLTVGAIFADVLPNDGSSWIVDTGTFEAHVADQFDRVVFVRAADGVAAADASRAIEGVLAGAPHAALEDRAGFADQVTSEIDAMLNLVYGLLALAVVIALIGIANTLGLSVHERRREIGLLRALGMTRRQVRATMRWESLLIALLGAALGTVLAVAAAWGIVQALAGEGVTSFVAPPAQLAVIAVAAGLAGVGASMLPARRAARLDVLDALDAV